MLVVVAAATLVVAAAGQNATAGKNATVWDTTVWDTRLGTMVSPECEPILAKAGLAWLTKPFKCSAGNHSTKPIVVGTGLGDTGNFRAERPLMNRGAVAAATWTFRGESRASGTHSVAAAVEALGFQSCHRWKINLELLRLSRPDDLRPFASADAYRRPGWKSSGQRRRGLAARIYQRRRVAARPRPRRGSIRGDESRRPPRLCGHSAETNRGAAAAATQTYQRRRVTTPPWRRGSQVFRLAHGGAVASPGLRIPKPASSPHDARGLRPRLHARAPP